MDSVRPFFISRGSHFTQKLINKNFPKLTNLENFYVSFVNDVYALNKSRNSFKFV